MICQNSIPYTLEKNFIKVTRLLGDFCLQHVCCTLNQKVSEIFYLMNYYEI